MRIMIVDVNISDMLGLDKCLKKAFPDAEVILQNDIATEAVLQVVENTLPDYVIIEAELGNRDGIALANRIKQKSPSTRIDIMNDSEEFATAAWRIHAHGYLLKPITEKKILKYL